MFHCENELELDAVWMSITKTVKPDDEELPLLRAASKARRAELRELTAQEKAEIEKKLIVKDLAREENTPTFGNFKRS
jgi:hypothetical protein